MLPTKCRAWGVPTPHNLGAALTAFGRRRCWGVNEWGQLGRGSTATVGDVPGEVAALSDVDLGPGPTAVQPASPPLCTLVTDAGSCVRLIDSCITQVQLAVGYGHTCTLLDDGELKCWGWNNFGQLGLGDRCSTHSLPTREGPQRAPSEGVR